jgi:hypothetical protein
MQQKPSENITGLVPNSAKSMRLGRTNILRGKVFKNANIYGTINVSELIKEVSFT